MSVTLPAGFAANGLASGIKISGGLDLALVSSTLGPVPAAAVFTTNRAAAAPVQVSRRHMRASKAMIGAVVLNSGIANAATGEAGLRTAKRAAALVAGELALLPEAVLVCSTGVIGEDLAIGPFEDKVAELVAGAASTAEASELAARAIMTTDTVPKLGAVEGSGYLVGGIAKGAGMLAPNLATMLAILTTDARAEPPELDAALRDAVAGSFHELSVDGCTSTNDTVIALASGASGRTPARGELAGALSSLCGDLARQMALDAEGATKLVEVLVTGASDGDEARRAARQVAESALVKCSWYGSDPNWGRIVSELGVAVDSLDLDALVISYGPITVFERGRAACHDRHALASYMAGGEIEVLCELGLGTARARMLSTDLSLGYVEENMAHS